MKLTTTTWVSVDGVMQGLGGADEDPSGGFERGGWAMPLFNGETETALNEIYARADAFLFGRRTFEVFAGSWGTMADPSQNPIAAGVEHATQVRGLEHDHRPAVGRRRRSSPVTSRTPSGS